MTWLRRAKSQHLSIRADEIACIGDGENDIPMFKNAGIRFAMGNASPALKACADRIVASNDDDGVAEAIQFLLT
ncbi:MAG: HAD hydrolase family protein [Fusicatenibacter sp.]|nr:HAD hydrolase family protein [Lachnospiraceae bacterium]MDY2938775.1 HAD hydrolase family protein [Fusicatenibacter sp.]